MDKDAVREEMLRTPDSSQFPYDLSRRKSRDRIGLVAIGRNEGTRLELCLRSLSGWENVIYVDSASTDGSITIAEKLGVKVLALAATNTLTAARGRNSGAALFSDHSNIDYIQFIDGDCELIPGWLDSAIEFLDRHPNIAAVCGRRMERDPHASIYNKLADREWNTAIGEAESTGGDALVRLDAFREVGGFADDQAAHEEPEFCARLRANGWKVWRIMEPMTIHDAATFKLKDFYLRSRRGGMGMTQALLRFNTKGDTASRTIIKRAIVWAVLLPAAAILLLALNWKLSIALLTVYLLQWIRLSVRETRNGYFSQREALKVAALNIVGKFAEADGAIRFLFSRILSGRH